MRFPALLAALLLAPVIACAQFGPEPPAQGQEAAWEKSAAEAKRIDERNAERFGKDPDYLVRPGLLASRKDKTVTIQARATSVKYGDAIEFFLIPQDSGKDYEALAVAFCKPSDVHAALEFIGMKAGRPANYVKHQYWPKGERVLMSFQWEQPPDDAHPTEAAAMQKARAEQLIINTDTKKPLPMTGLIFAGSYTFVSEETKRTMYAADVMDSKSIASDFNDPTTVLDVPRQAPKGAVYDTQKLNPAYRFRPGQLVQVTLEPEHKDGKTRVRDLALKLSHPAGAPAGVQGLACELLDAEGKPAAEGQGLIHMLGAFGKMIESDLDPYVTLHLDRGMPLRTVAQTLAVLSQLDNENGIRIEAPPPGQLYYRAFFPNPEWRERSNRLGKPWELHLVSKDRRVAGMLILPADEIDDNNGQGDLKFPVATAEETARILTEKSGRFSQVVYVFAPGTITYGQLMDFISPAMKTHPGIYVFLPEGAKPGEEAK